jgi:hypothetical protein
MAETLNSLARDAARRLIGRDIRLEHRAPGIAGRDGQALKTARGPVIQICPYCEDWLSVFLHELAHVKLHYDRLPGEALQALPPQGKNLTGIERLTSSRTHPVINRQEAEADALAARWLAYALKVEPYGGMPDRLYALTNYTEQEITQ